jgi:hypothetical protein
MLEEFGMQALRRLGPVLDYWGRWQFTHWNTSDARQAMDYLNELVADPSSDLSARWGLVLFGRTTRRGGASLIVAIRQRLND